MRLAGDQRAAAHALVHLGQRPGAVDHARAALDHEIGIGADHREIAGPQRFELRAILLGCFALVVEQAGADDDLGRVHGDGGDRQALDQSPVAFRADEIDLLRPLRLDQLAGDVAGADDRIEGAIGHADAGELAHHAVGAARGIGDQHHRQARLARRLQRGAGLQEGGLAIMHHPPDIAENDVIQRDDIPQTFDTFGHQA